LGYTIGKYFFSTSALAGDMVITSKNNLHLSSGSNNSAITIKTNNNFGIGTNSPSNILQVGNTGRVRISNGTKKKGLSFISNRQRRKEGTFSASELAGIEPTPARPGIAGYARLNVSATGGIMEQLIIRY
jgi:hypothetical protein